MFGLCYLWCFYKFLAWVVGIYSFVHMTISFGFWVYKSFIRKNVDFLERYGKGSWVVVTGPTSGIGEAYAIEFARHGFNIVLMGRNKEKLAKTEAFVKDLNKNVKVRIVEADFSTSMEAGFYEDLYSKISDLDISILVNNAAIGMVKHFERVTPDELLQQVYTNAGSPIMLSHVLVKKLRDRKSRSAIINISSVADRSPTPYTGAYPATKIFLTFLSYGLYGLYRDKIDVLNVTPGYVTTNMTKGRTGVDTCTAKECAQGSLKSLGHDFDVCPFYMHAIYAQVLHTTYKFLTPLWKASAANNLEMMALKEFYKENEQKLKAKKND